MKLLNSICLLFIIAVSATACHRQVSGSNGSARKEASSGRATDYAGLVEALRVAGMNVKPAGAVEQPFFSVEGRVIEMGGEHVQVFEYADPAAAGAEAALVSRDGSTVGTTKVHWLGPPHFYKKGRILVLYVGDDGKVLKALEAALGKQFAGR